MRFARFLGTRISFSTNTAWGNTAMPVDRLNASRSRGST